MPRSKEVETLLSRFAPAKRAELEKLLQPDVITWLATIEDPALAQQLAEDREKPEIFLSAFGYLLDSVEMKVARDTAEYILTSARTRESVARIGRSVGAPPNE